MYSSESAGNQEIHKLLRERYPELRYISRKSCNSQSFGCIVLQEDGVILHQTTKAFQILELLTDPNIDFLKPTYSCKGFRLNTRPIPITERIREAEWWVSFLATDRGAQMYPKDYRRRISEWKMTLKELKGEV